ncbi:MAG: phosphotransferase [Bacillota bacterium]
MMNSIKRNAIILAAGKSTSFAPFTYEKPKGLFCVKGEILIERQVRQMKEAGIDEIIVVIGYMKEKFFYLEQKYGVILIVNNNFSSKGNLYSVFKAREYLNNTFICCADQYFVDNPFLEENNNNNSYRACAYYSGEFKEFGVEYSDANIITDMTIGGRDSMVMVGHVYFNECFSNRFIELMEEEIEVFRISSMFWEEFYKKHQSKLTLHMIEVQSSQILEFDRIEDLIEFDAEFLNNIDSEIIKNIICVLQCSAEDIVDIQVIQAGLTNVSFMFCVKNIKYVYRHPGGTAGNLVNRQAEMYAQKIAKETGVDISYIHMDESGWKISYYVDNLVECNFRKYPKQFKLGMEFLRRIHSEPVTEDVKIFDNIQEGKKLIGIASSTKGNLFLEFKDIIEKIDKLDCLVKEDAQKRNVKKVFCHNDTYEPNYLATENGELYLIDWEYSGINYPANDLACILCRNHFSDEEIYEYFEEYLQRKPTFAESRHFISYIALCAFYWFSWGLYKGSVGDDDSFFFLPAYRSCIRYIDKALALFEDKED